MRQSASAALVSAALMGLTITACREAPTAPGVDNVPASTPPAFAFTGGSGKVLASTNQGELVEIDLDLGTATLIGDAGTYSGKTLGWTDIALDSSGTLFALSRFATEVGTSCSGDPCSHLYQISLQNGGVVTEIGSTEQRFLSEIDFAGDSLFGAFSYLSGLYVGRLFSLDPSTAALTFTPDTFGLNPYASNRPLASGGFAVHPLTGELWGVESQWSNAPVLYRIDRSTGAADSIIRLGLGGQALPKSGGLDGLHILDDGTFIATRGAGAPKDSALWEIDPVPDPTSGLAEIALIPLTFDTLIVGSLNGLESAPSGGGGTLTLSLSADTTILHPWIDSTTFLTPDTLFVQDDRVGDSVSVMVTTSLGGAPSSGASVVVTAELVPGAGGHSHQADRIGFGDLPTFSYAAGGPRPVGGFFKQGSTRSDSIVATTDSLGQVAFKFIAGFLGGRVDLVVNASLGGAQVADTLKLTVKVPGLVDLVTQGSLADSVYFIGPKQPHQSDSTWYAHPAFASAIRALVSQLSRPAASEYLRLNDSSLPMGGSFNLESLLFEVSSGNEVDRPGVSHRSHAYGVDIDVSVCFSDTNGKQTGFINPSCGASSVDRDRMFEQARSKGLIPILEGSPPHFHLRLGSETLRVPL